MKNTKDNDAIQVLKDRISELEKSLAEKKLSEEKLKLITENTTDNIAIVSFDIKSIYEYVSPSVKTVIGYEPEDLVGKSFFDFIHPDDKKVLYPVLKKYVNQKLKNLLIDKENAINETIEYRFKNKIGDWRNMQSTVNIVGKKLLSVTRDITERMKANDALSISEKKYKELVEKADIAIITDDRKGNLTYFNKYFPGLYGYTEKEITKKSIQKLVHPDDVNKVMSIHNDRLAGKKVPSRYEFRGIRKDGTVVHLEADVSLLKEDGTSIGTRSYIWDITDRILAEEIEKKYQFIIANTLDMLWTTDLEFNSIYVNDTIFKFLGYTQKEFLGMNLAVFTTPDGMKAIRKATKELISGHKTGKVHQVNFELQQIRKDGTIIDVETISGLALDSIGNIIGFQGRSIDISNRKQIQKEIELKSKELEKHLKNSEKQRVATISVLSDLNTTTRRLQSEIVEHKKVEEKLLAANKNLEMLGKTVSSMNECVSISDNEHKIIFANNSFLKTYGMKRKDIIGKSSSQFMLEKSSEMRNEIRRKTRLGGWKGELLNKKKDGTIFPIELSVTPLKDDNGEIIAQIGISVDISERVEIEKRIKDSERNYQKFFLEDLTGDYLSTEDGKILDCNPAFIKMMGFKSLKEIQNYDPIKFHGSKEIREKFIQQVYKEKKLTNVISEVFRKDGEKLIIQENTIGEFDDKGKLINIRGYINDITKRVRAEQEVNKLSAAIEQSPVSIVITNTKGLIEYVNPIFEDITGYSSNEVIGNKPNILKSGITPEDDYKNLWETITKGQIWTGEFVNKKKDGELYWESATISPVLDNNKNITHYLAIKQDISEKKQFIANLMEREEKYRTLTYNLNVGVYRSTPGVNGKVIEANPAFLRMFDFRSKSELERYRVTDFYPDSSARKAIEDKLLSKGFVINEELKLRRKDGTIFWASMSATLAKNELGDVIHYDGIIEDIEDEYKTREDILTYQTNLKSLSNELLVMEEDTKRQLAITLHDNLGQYLVLSKFKISELNKIISNLKHKKLIEEITGYISDAINESRNITYELSPPVLYEMGLVQAINWKLDEISKNYKIETSLINRLESFEIKKKEQIILYRSINELLQNVLKHSKAEKVNVSFQLIATNYRIVVSDDGIGFDLETVREKALSMKKFGIFSIIERIKYMGGNIEINTGPNKGTKIIIILPIKD